MQKQIPDNWQKEELGKLLQPRGYIRGPFGSSLKRGELLSEGIPVYEQQNAINNHRDFCFFIKKQKISELRRFSVLPDDLVISCSGSLGKVTIIQTGDPLGIISQALLILRPDTNKLLPRFLYYFLTSKEGFKAMTSRSTGSAMTNIASRDIIESIELLKPPLSYQKTVIEILTSLDNKIEVNNKIAKTLEEMAQAIFKEWFVTGKKWEMGKLQDLVVVKNGFAFKSKDYRDSGIPIIRTMNFTNNKSVILDDIVYLSEEKAKEYNSFYLDKFDLLLVMVGASIGKIAIVPSNILPALQNQNMWAFKPKKEEHRFFSNLLVERLIDQQKGSSTGSARDFFRKDYFYSLEIPVPNMEIISEFNKIISPIYVKLDNILGENQKLAALRDLLLPKLMKGEIRV